MKVLVVIVTYNAMPWIDRCLTSLRESVESLDVMVIDNLSTDETQERIKTNYPEVILSVSNQNLGFGQGNNIGLKYALEHNYDYVYLLNQDAWIYPDTIQKLIQTQQEHPEYGILSPLQLQSDGKQLDSIFSDLTCGFESNNRLVSDLFLSYRKDVYEVTSVMAAHWLVSKACLEKVGGFSPSFFQYGEDDNYLDRAKHFGFKIGIVPEAKAIHARENRPYSRKKTIERLYISNVLVMSKVENRKKNPFLYVFLNCIRNMFKYTSVKPIGQFFRVLANCGKIRRNYLASLKPGAFIKDTD